MSKSDKVSSAFESPLYRRYQQIYSEDAETYDRLVSCEDKDDNLLPAIACICNFKHKYVVELGCGTGRLTRKLLPHVKTIHAFDVEVEMINVAKRYFSEVAPPNCTFAIAEHSSIPLEDKCADICIAAWTINHVLRQEPELWRERVKEIVKEMSRILKTDGTIVIVETLGIGVVEPQAPTLKLREYYYFLEGELGFACTWTRTDYQFESTAEAGKLIGFFFGEELRQAIIDHNMVVVPECTGIWSRTSKHRA